MSGKLDKPLDEITSQRRAAGRRQSQRRSAGRPAAVQAPVGGVKKAGRPARGAAAKQAPAKSVGPSGFSKIIVSNLPKDVSEQQIKEYFAKSVGPIRKVEISYGPNSQSRGIANVIFSRADGASTAFQKLNGLLVDSRPIKIEIVVDATQADKVIPPPAKTLAERTTQPKAQPKSAAANKAKGNNAKAGAAKGVAGKKKTGRNARPAKKTNEELDSEMADYFTTSADGGNTAAPAAAAPTAGDASMEDEIM